MPQWQTRSASPSSSLAGAPRTGGVTTCTSLTPRRRRGQPTRRRRSFFRGAGQDWRWWRRRCMFSLVSCAEAVHFLVRPIGWQCCRHEAQRRKPRLRILVQGSFQTLCLKYWFSQTYAVLVKAFFRPKRRIQRWHDLELLKASKANFQGNVRS